MSATLQDVVFIPFPGIGPVQRVGRIVEILNSTGHQLPITLFEEAAADEDTNWDSNRVVEALVQQRSIEPDAARRISQEVEAELKRKNLAQITPRAIVSLVDEQLVKHGFEQELNISVNAVRVLERRYLRRATDGKILERPKDMFARVARTIASADKKFDDQADTEETARSFYQMITSMEFMPNSPTLMNAGRQLGQLSACFVLPVDDSMESIFEAVKNTAMIHKSGGGTGFSFSRVRPKNDVVLSTQGVSSGPVSFMRVFDTATETIKQGGTRRGANMGILRVDHPDILDFIACKTEQKSLNNFNISVAITESFMSAVEKNANYDLVNPHTNKVVKTLEARKVFNTIVSLAWRNGEPGIIFIDRLNKENPTPHVGEIESTNPCGEQPLLPYESCNLGSINLAKMAKDGHVDWDRLKATVHNSIHFLDNVIEINRYPLPEIERVTKGNRKIGLGVMGYADLLIQLAVPYNSEASLKKAEEIMSFIQTEARSASANLAEVRGEFPNFKGSVYDHPGIRPLRNATVTTIAPTGTISIIAGCSSGVEPLFAISFVRNVMDNDELVEVNPLFAKVARQEGFYSKELMRKIAEQGTLSNVPEVPEPIRRKFVTAHDVSPEWHIRTQAAFQKYTDNAVSKTVNLTKEATEADVAEVYRLAYILGCKGVTVYRDGSRDEQVLNIEKVNRSGQQGEIATRAPGKLKPRERPEVVRGSTQKMTTGCGNLYVTINEDDEGIFELFTAMGKAGGCASSQAEAISRLISLTLRAGVDAEDIIRQLAGVRCPSPVWKDGEMILSCADAMSRALKHYTEIIKERDAKKNEEAQPKGKIAASSRSEPAEQQGKQSAVSARPKVMLSCPDCGGTIEHIEGCMLCRECGFSKCS
ncbi:MAG: vitamin B12-dependent ribonucleotide reductase [Deltaproteobacteria bacterium]|nr:vitamin B12-dependent ribonucleotide reductase [Deltaproteobacteria bacterium]